MAAYAPPSTGAGQGIVRAFRTILVISLLSLTATQAHAATTLRTMNEVGAAIRACWTPPPAAKGAFVILDFSVRRDGTLIGPPWASFIRVPGDARARQTFISAAITALEHCAPLPLAPVLGDNIAGQVFTMRFPAAG
jgi:hypothetical protein